MNNQNKKLNISRTGARVEIYALLHPITKEVRYIGKANDSQKRLASHLRDCKRRNTPVYYWIRKLLSENLKPEIKILSIIAVQAWQSEEIRLISEYKANGCKLLNVALGGDEPFCSLETRQQNAKRALEIRESNPKKKELWRLKNMIISNLRFLKKNAPELYSVQIKKMQYRAAVRPDLFLKFI